jgi:rhodanese-related sulfurtransferase
MKHLLPRQAWDLLQANPHALLIDVRMEIESMYVGRPPGAVHVAWYEYPEFTPNVTQFCNHVLSESGGKDRPVVLMCRSGQRTIDAGLALESAGFTDVSHVVHGFEGDLDAHFQRSSVNGWRHEGLPWEQM